MIRINAWISQSKYRSRTSYCSQMKRSWNISLITTYFCLPLFLPVNKDVCPSNSSSGVGEEASPTLLCHKLLYLPVSYLFQLLTTNLLAQAICKNGNYFAWQGISLELNNGSSPEIWQQGLTFGSLCLLPRLIYVSRLCSVPHQEEVLQETEIWGRI